MVNKIIKCMFIFITLFCLKINIRAYEFIDPENEGLVNDKIIEIYDAKEQYEDLVGGYIENETQILTASSDAYWWPIGSAETEEINGVVFAKGDPETVRTTSPFGYRDDPFGRGFKAFHSGLDIAGGRGEGQVNIIAAKDGIVVKTFDGCESSRTLSNCGGGYGNHVIIQHSDGNFTLYGHMYQNSVDVSEGSSVNQGQVIGKMGSSGNSTGAHLHFEVREGQNSSQNTVDPLTYISADTPRVVFTGDEFLSWINSWEGSSPREGDYYIVEDIGDGVRTVGSGVVLEFNVERFAQYGINTDDYPVGSKMPVSIVDQVELEEIAKRRSYVENVLASNSITLSENQMQALTSMVYNCGNINGFVDAYNRYGDTQEFFDNWFLRAISKGTIFEKGLTRRRYAEWSLFHAGEYVYNG